MQISMIIQDDNDKTGYMLMYGSNEKVGGYQIQGTVTKDLGGTITYDMKYTFNDIMDPEFGYLDDRIKYKGLSTVKTFNDNITMNDYEFHVSWADTTIIYAGGRENEGWLKNMKSVDVEEEINELTKTIRELEGVWWLRGSKSTAETTKEIYVEMQNYMRSHPEYYGCFAE